MLEWKFYGTINDDSRNIRKEVFVDEQGFTEEFGGKDDDSLHIVIYKEGSPAATARMIELGGGRFLIGRVAVLARYRGAGLGSLMLKLLEEKAREKCGDVIEISAQCQAQSFYEKNGYTAMGDIYFDEDRRHIHMEKEL